VYEAEEHLKTREVGERLERLDVLLARVELGEGKPRDGLHVSIAMLVIPSRAGFGHFHSYRNMV
jgi:hypothetical protein